MPPSSGSRPAADAAVAGVPAPPAASGSLQPRRRHAFESLLELSRELVVDLDLHATADLLLFNLMGQFGVSRAALWLSSDEEPRALALVRSHGCNPGLLRALSSSACGSLLGLAVEEGSPTPVERLAPRLSSAERALLEGAHLALAAPLYVRGEALGLLAMGPRADGSPFSAEDLEVLQAALVMVGVSLQNARLYSRMRHVNRQLRQSNEHLRELDQLKSQFLSNVNHELRTPLTVIIASLECVVEQSPREGPERALLQASLEKSRHLHGIVENLLALSDLSRDALSVESAPIEVGLVMEGFYSVRLPGVSASLREFVFERDPDLPMACADPDRMIQIVDELLENGIKFTPRGARLELRVRCLDEAGQAWIGVELVDNGPGIPPRRLETLFGSFEQLDGSSTREVGGLGLGLALARQLAERMGGRLQATSTPGEGTTFRLLLPPAHPAPPGS